ncbi:unnamed protein product [Cylindrotheca closterium]|uniref:Uncharacterized protein n=1 Tax=Cylindrotheca closterium TaxID=2856 RepID=A0AAD2CA96_9STRA|nr:unnamed protein product [Cylindrotheca closterium]
MQPSHHHRKRRRRRTKQTLQAPRRLDRNAEQELKKLVWVTVGKTEHQAWLLEDVKGKNVVSIRWETTGTEERVPVLSIRHEAPDDGRRSRRRRTSVQESLTDLPETSIQFPRKRKRQQTKSKPATTIAKEGPIQKEPSEGGRRENGGEKVESARLAEALSVLSDIRSGPSAELSSKRPKNQGKADQGKKSALASSISKPSLTELGSARKSASSDIRQNRTPISGSPKPDPPASSDIASGTKSTKVVGSVAAVIVSKHEEELNDDDSGYLI